MVEDRVRAADARPTDRQLSGTARGFSNAQPAWPVMTIAATKCPNPLLIVDEIDKAGGSAQYGRPHHALLSMLEPGSAKNGPIRVCWLHVI